MMLDERLDDLAALREAVKICQESIRKLEDTPVFILAVLYTDASKFGAGCALLQHREEQDFPILYDSFLFTKTQRQYGTYKRELCALVEFCRRHRHFFCGRSLSTVYTDHMPLTWFLTGQGHEGIYARWVTELRVLNITIKYIEGARNGAADGLSRSGGLLGASLFRRQGDRNDDNFRQNDRQDRDRGYNRNRSPEGSRSFANSRNQSGSRPPRRDERYPRRDDRRDDRRSEHRKVHFKAGSQCRPVVAAGESAARALSDYLTIHGSNPTADGGARDPHMRTKHLVSKLARAISPSLPPI
ncbi:hypothetical protein G6O67_003606 [Ophiocordyceps sinensis]|uniref:Reverse transcriptase RNase H-like domain-containing protein n=1 Tax=Ophiocordyceps sinensis TaxID=72228 RepID=A0A8H4PS42_9HYPO|nr:hypothetical protein G6O67_003606 [Ophiocordyceps sinensis]